MISHKISKNPLHKGQRGLVSLNRELKKGREMGKRYVSKIEKDGAGDIIKLHNPLECWSPRGKANAIGDIMLDLHEYWLLDSEGSSSPIELVREEHSIYLHAPSASDDPTPPI